VTVHLRYPGRWQLSVLLAVAQVAIGVLHLWPHLVYPANPATTKVVAALSSLGPVWVAWFGVTGIALIVSLVANRLIHVAHMLAGSSWIAYAFALEVGAWSSHGTHFLPAVTAIVAAVHIISAVSYSNDARERGDG
jgi:hypothetical protein